MKHERRVPHKLFAETQMGIVTRFGDWFHITSEQIEEFVPGLLKKIELEQLVRSAQAWVKSADSLSMILALIMLVSFNPLVAAGLTLIFHFGWYINKSSLVAISVDSVLELLYKDGTQLVVSLVVLSYLGLMGQYLAVGIGLIFFFILKLGLLKKVWDKIFLRLKDGPLTLNDRVMKMVIIKYAIYENVAPDEVQKMEEQIKELATSRKRNN